MFELTAKEFENLRSKIGTSSRGYTNFIQMAFKVTALKLAKKKSKSQN